MAHIQEIEGSSPSSATIFKTENIIIFKQLIASTALLVAVPTLAATEITTTEEDGTVTGTFADTITEQGDFTSEFFFELDFDGLASGSITQIAVNTLSDIDFSEVLFNGQAFTLNGNGFYEFGSVSNVVVNPGIQNLLVRGSSGGNGSFAGTISVMQTAAVPEPSTWALLLLGFAAVGASMRSAKQPQEHRVRYSM